jgi:hexosaminidase
LITDWGDGGHPQPLAVSWLPFAAGAALAWSEKSFEDSNLIPVLSRDIFQDPSGRAARAAYTLGLAHRKLRFTEPNLTPLGAVIAAPPPETRELFCHNGLKYHSRIQAKNIRETLRMVKKQRGILESLRRSPTIPPAGKLLVRELELAARMAEHSCRFMLWQKTLAVGKIASARSLARSAISELIQLKKDFDILWPSRNKGNAHNSSAFLDWRISDYRKGILLFSQNTTRSRRHS